MASDTDWCGEATVTQGNLTARPDSGTVPEPFVGRDGFAILALSGVVLLASFGASFMLALIHVIRAGLAAPADIGGAGRILVLGYRLRQPHPEAVYRARLDRALVLLRRTPTARVFLLGGRRRADLPSEAAAGRIYLRTQGVDARRIREEDGSRHTLENLRHYRAAYPAGGDERTVLVSSRFHLARAAMMARGLGLAVTPCAAETDRLATVLRPDRLLTETLMLHWYVVGRCFSRWTGNVRMLARIS